MHPRNKHQGRYDLIQLQLENPSLSRFVKLNPNDELTIDFSDPIAVKALNKTLLKSYYQIKEWDIPAQFLCPPIPGRADYIHYLADLLISNDNKIKGLDIGVGANMIYPLIGIREYDWQFVGVDIDQTALKNAQKILDTNTLSESVSLRLQSDRNNIFKGIIKEDDYFDFTMCNPPFHASLEDAKAGSRRKLNNLAKKANQPLTKSKNPKLNFGGQATELYCDGGEIKFIKRMIEESVEFKNHCRWFTTLVSKASHLPSIYNALKNINAREIRTVEMAQGQKHSRFVAWSFK
ncbi:MAG: Ribosomal large subunit methyltransferase [Pseudomonadota bacterium]|jgi:23S rRNA (adenine1618-N6)-methyltransferase